MVLFLLSSCSQYRIVDNVQPFKDLYSVTKNNYEDKKDELRNNKNYTLSGHNMLFADFVRWFSDSTGFGIIYSSKLEDLKISFEFKNSTVNEIINLISKRNNFKTIQVGNTYYIGDISSDDRSVLVRNVNGYTAEEITNSVSSVIGEFGRVKVFPNGVTVVSDTENNLMKVNQMLDMLESEEENSWVLQLYFISIRKEVLTSQGVEVQPSGKLAYDILNSSQKSNMDYDLKLDAVLNSSFNSNYSNLRSAPMFLLRDGAKASWQDGESVPIPKKSVSEYGTVQTLDYDYKQTGLIVNVSLRESKQGCNIQFNISDSRIVGYNELAPKVVQVALETDLHLSRGGIYLVGELNSSSDKNSVQKYLNFNDDDNNTILQVWARAYRIAGDVKIKTDDYKNNLMEQSFLENYINK